MTAHARSEEHTAGGDDHEIDDTLVVHALGSTGGAVLVVDPALRVVAATPAAARLLGAPVKRGSHVVRALAGSDSGIAGAFVCDRSVVTMVHAGRPSSETRARVRVTPLRSGREHLGWIVRLTEEPAGAGIPRALETLSTQDAATGRILEIAELLADSEASVLISGEMGVGKASLAAAIHARSARRAQPLRVLASATMTPEVLEHQLLGAPESESVGTLLLDDVGELPHESQGWLLRALETAHVTPTDGGAPRAIDVRTFATSRVPLEREVEAGRFRADLLVRLRTVALELPPLRARAGDVRYLVQRFVTELNARGKRHVTSIAPEAMSRLEQHDWPGNVRELRVAIEAAFALGRGAILAVGDVSRSLPPLSDAPPEVALAPAPDALGPTDEATRVRRALERAGGDKARTAAMLGMSRTTLWRRLRALGLDR